MPYTIPQEYKPPLHSGPLPENALSLEWTGTAGFRIEYKNSILLIDPFTTRPGILKTALLPLAPNSALSQNTFPAAHNILIGHSHYDHLMDAPGIAKNTGATIHGSNSTANVCRAAGLPENQIHIVDPGTSFQCGPFSVAFINSLHGKALFGRNPCPGEIEPSPTLPMKFKQYKSGATYGILIQAGQFKIYHCGSADLIEEETAKAGKIDILLLGIAGRKKTPDYLRRITTILAPQFLIPQHYDNFFKPISRGLNLLFSIGIDSFLEEAKTACPDAKIIMPGILDKIAFDTTTTQLLKQ